MKQARELVQAFKDIVGKDVNIFPATVKSVDKESNTCVVDFEELDLGGVRLQSIEKATKGLTIYPAIGSVVLVQRLTDEDYFICMFSEIDQVVIKTDETVFEVKDGVLVKKGDDTLKDALLLIVQAVQQITVLYGNNPDYAKLQQAVTKINNILK
ncbi:hypothetical protein [Pinibacter soli]|uniref:Uncharacterized protein n=1 Tax=Pinibacter soli TaxID=3044211 RepID=A0ABT6R9H1_9BACT|nr:hypothetical protein [Pinibacter soli]MDI3319126.1 hypothetical protein [Pinibacter soli]